MKVYILDPRSDRRPLYAEVKKRWRRPDEPLFLYVADTRRIGTAQLRRHLEKYSPDLFICATGPNLGRREIEVVRQVLPDRCTWYCGHDFAMPWQPSSTTPQLMIDPRQFTVDRLIHSLADFLSTVQEWRPIK